MAGSSAKKFKGFMTEVSGESARTRKAFPVYQGDLDREKEIHTASKSLGVAFNFSDALEATYLDLLEAAEKEIRDKAERDQVVGEQNDESAPPKNNDLGAGLSDSASLQTGA